MPNTLKIKRGTAATIPQGQLAEPLFTTDTYDLYIGKGSGGNQRIQNYIASGTSSQFLKGDGSLDSTVYQATSEKGQNNGYASLDAGGKIPASQLPSSVIEYKGTWNASTNTPTLADGTGDAGDVYIVSVGGTQNLGSGSITFDAGDWVMYNGSVWQKSTGSNAVASVNGQTGVVTITFDQLSPMTTLGDTIYGAASGAGTRLAGNITVTKKFLSQTGTGTASAAPSWQTVTQSDVGLSNVENTALSTWAGSANITTLGTITSGTWNGTTIAIANGGTGQTTKAAAFNALSPMTTLGDIIYGGASGAGTRLAGNTAASKRFLIQTGDGTNSAAPSWGSIAAGDVPTLNQNTTGSAATLTTARTFTIGATGKTFDGSANVSWSLAEIGAQAALTNPVTGTGTIGYISKFTTTGSTIGESIIYDDGTKIGIRTSSPRDTFVVSNNGAIVSERFSGETTFSGDLYFYSARGTLASPTAKINGDTTMGIRARAHDGTTYLESASIESKLDGVTATNVMYGNLVFSTNNGGTTLSERMIINSSGTIRMNNYTTNGLAAFTGGNGTLSSVSRTINGTTFDGSANITITANTTNAITFNNGGSGAASGTTFDGSTARTISYNTIGAQPLLTNPVTGTGTENRIAKFTATGSAIGDSLIYDNGTNVSIGTATPLAKFHVQSSGSTYSNPADSNVAGIYVYNSTNNSTSAHSFISLRTNSANGGNPFVSWDIGGVIGWSAGIDNADGDSFKIANEWNSLTSNTRLKIDGSGNVRFNAYTSNGFLKSSGGDGTIVVDTNTYLTGNQTITLSGDVTGSGATSIATTIANNAVTTSKINNAAVTAAKLATFGHNDAINWSANTDDAFIKFVSTGDGAGESALEIGTGDNGNERIRFTQRDGAVTYTRVYIDTDGELYKGGGTKYVYNSGTWDINTTGSAATLTTARNFTINGTAKSFDGSANVSWTAAEIGLTSYLPLAGGAMTGRFTLSNNNSTYTNPETTNVPSIYIYNSNNASTSAHSILALRTNTANGGNPFVSYDISGVIGWSTGIDNADGDSFKISNDWQSISTSTALKISVTTLATTLYGALSGTSATFSSSVTATGGTASYSTSALPTATISTTTTGAINAAYTSIRIGARGQSGQDQSVAITNVPTADGNSAIAFTTMDSYSYAERMRITSGGNVGIGTASPTEKLHISSSASSTEIRIENSTTSAYIRSQTDNLNFYFNAAERMRITSGGNVGIGTTSPAKLLSLYSTGNDLDTGGVLRITGNSAGDAIDISVKDTQSRIYHQENSGDAANGYGILQLRTNAAANSSFPTRGGFKFTVDTNDALVITNTSNVGIGTTAPSTSLHILGSGEGIYIGRIAGAVDYGGHVRMQKARGTTTTPTIVANGDTLGTLTFEPYNGTAYAEQTGIRGIVNGAVSAGSIPVDMIFCAGTSGTTGSNERMRITSGGVVSINQTSGYGILNITGTNASWGEGLVLNPAPNGYMGLNFRLEGATGSTVTGTWQFGKVSSSESSGEAMSINKNALTGGTAYRADASQQWKTNGDSIFGFRVGIGLTSPNSSYKLDVNGSIQATSYFESSDKRYKTLLENNIDNIKILNIQSKYYEKNGKKELGYFAQDFENILDCAISKRDDGYLDLSYRQVHTAKIAALEEKIKELEAKLK